MTEVFNIFLALGAEGTAGGPAPAGKPAGGSRFDGLLDAAQSQLAGLGPVPGQPAMALISGGQGAAQGGLPGGALPALAVYEFLPVLPGGPNGSSVPEGAPATPSGEGTSLAFGTLSVLPGFVPHAMTLPGGTPQANPAGDAGTPGRPPFNTIPTDGDPLERLLAATPRPAGAGGPAAPVLPEQAADAARTALNAAADRIVANAAERSANLPTDPANPTANPQGPAGNGKSPMIVIAQSGLNNSGLNNNGTDTNRTSSASLPPNGGTTVRADGAEPSSRPDESRSSDRMQASTPRGSLSAANQAGGVISPDAVRLAANAAAAEDRRSGGPLPLQELKGTPSASSPAMPAGFDAMATATPTAETNAAANAYARAAAAAAPHPLPQPAAEQIAVHLASALKEGLDQITIHLRPASLGQIDVQLNVHADGRVQAVVMADRPETLDLLQKDARELTRALQDAGLKADSNSLNFGLRGGEGGRQWDFGGARHWAVAPPDSADESSTGTVVPAVAALALGRGASPYGIDIRV